MQIYSRVLTFPLVAFTLVAMLLVSSNSFAQSPERCKKVGVAKTRLIKRCLRNNNDLCLQADAPVWCMAACEPQEVIDLEDDQEFIDGVARWSRALRNVAVECPCTGPECSGTVSCRAGECASTPEDNNNGDFIPEGQPYPVPTGTNFIPEGGVYPIPDRYDFIPQGNTYPIPSRTDFIPESYDYPTQPRQDFIPEGNTYPIPARGNFIPEGSNYPVTPRGDFIPEGETYPVPPRGNFIPEGTTYYTSSGDNYFTPEPNYANLQQTLGGAYYIPFISPGGYLPGGLGFVPQFNYFTPWFYF